MFPSVDVKADLVGGILSAAANKSENDSDAEFSPFLLLLQPLSTPTPKDQVRKPLQHSWGGRVGGRTEGRHLLVLMEAPLASIQSDSRRNSLSPAQTVSCLWYFHTSEGRNIVFRPILSTRPLRGEVRHELQSLFVMPACSSCAHVGNLLSSFAVYGLALIAHGRAFWKTEPGALGEHNSLCIPCS